MRIDRQQAFSGTTASDIDAAALATYLEQHVDGFAGPLMLARFKGGQSNPTYKLMTPTRSYVLRRKPFGKLLPSAHAIEREYRVTEALARAGFPVAKPLHLCADAGVIGAAFYVMEHAEGRVFWEPHAPGLSGHERAALFDSLNATIAQLHRLDPVALGLGDFGKPQGYVARQIRRWSEQYRASETEAIPEMDRLIAWLPGACPADSGAAIVHGDFRLDNCIVHPTEPRVIAVLDWELSTLGDPLADFTYHLMQWFMPVSETGAGVGSLLGHERDPGVPAIEAYTADYCRRTGRSGIPELPIYLAYNFFRLAAILQGILGRVRDGTAANAEAAVMARQVRPLAETAWAFARKAGA
ncbi:phosphotransferase family protein [Aestuariivirga litoralis]|uniref:Phosphotransferase family protein n=1 Tax=Aestuariivirga litoralis TaxID=2650924 RepID=A0A2W2AQM2_9HYPH|nr:phosphotransferase family protein [Aestuariivirga litoralis]PZF77691.1 phosphotransferase family protein [Aestuariivirga litoralis]